MAENFCTILYVHVYVYRCIIQNNANITIYQRIN